MGWEHLLYDRLTYPVQLKKFNSFKHVGQRATSNGAGAVDGIFAVGKNGYRTQWAWHTVNGNGASTVTCKFAPPAEPWGTLNCKLFGVE